MPFEVFEHTADLGLRVFAPDLPALFAEAGRGLTSLIVEDLTTVEPTQQVAITIEGEEIDYLFFDWLHEILFRFETEHLILVEFDVQLRPGGVDVAARGEMLDRQRHRLGHEVKAITYHSLKIEQLADGLMAEVIVDI